MRRILAQTAQRTDPALRDKLALALALVLPVMQLILMGSAISLDVKNLPIAVQDFDDSPASRQFVDAFRASITFHVVPFPVDRQPENAFTSNDGPRRADHSGTLRARHRARRQRRPYRC